MFVVLHETQNLFLIPVLLTTPCHCASASPPEPQTCPQRRTIGELERYSAKAARRANLMVFQGSGATTLFQRQKQFFVSASHDAHEQ